VCAFAIAAAAAAAGVGRRLPLSLTRARRGLRGGIGTSSVRKGIFRGSSGIGPRRGGTRWAGELQLSRVVRVPGARDGERSDARPRPRLTQLDSSRAAPLRRQRGETPATRWPGRRRSPSKWAFPSPRFARRDSVHWTMMNKKRI
jgi:hypothetical protein